MEPQEGDCCQRRKCSGKMGYPTLCDYFAGHINCLECGAPQVVYEDAPVQTGQQSGAPM